MSDFSELIARYEAQGCSYHDAYSKAKRYMYNRKRYLEQKAVRDAINQMKVEDPARYSALVWEIEHAGEVAAREEEERARKLEEWRRREGLRRFRFENGLVVAGIPNIDFSGVEGMVAFRTWDVRQYKNALRMDNINEGADLFLGSTAMSSVWKPVMIADKIPAENNNSGLYCVKLDPLGLMTRASYYLGDVCGLLELRGRVLEHADGVVRAEWARIICVFIQANEKTGDICYGLRQSYPTVPMYVLHKEQIAEVLLRVTVIQSMREGETL